MHTVPIFVACSVSYQKRVPCDEDAIENSRWLQLTSSTCEDMKTLPQIWSNDARNAWRCEVIFSAGRAWEHHSRLMRRQKLAGAKDCASRQPAAIGANRLCHLLPRQLWLRGTEVIQEVRKVWQPQRKSSTTEERFYLCVSSFIVISADCTQ